MTRRPLIAYKQSSAQHNPAATLVGSGGLGANGYSLWKYLQERRARQAKDREPEQRLKTANFRPNLSGLLNGFLRRTPPPATLAPGYSAVTGARSYPIKAPVGVLPVDRLARGTTSRLVTGDLHSTTNQGLAARRLADAAATSQTRPLTDAGAESSTLHQLRSAVLPGAKRQTEFVHHPEKGVHDPRSFVERWAGIPQVQARTLGGSGAWGGPGVAERVGNTARSAFNILTTPAYTPKIVQRNPYVETLWRNAPRATAVASIAAPVLARDEALGDQIETGSSLVGTALGNPLSAANLALQTAGVDTMGDKLRRRLRREGRSALSALTE